MDIEEVLALQEKLFKWRMEIRRKKGHDYACDSDVHGNFDAIAQICKILNVNVTTPFGCAVYAKIQKLQRETNLLFNDKTPSNEAILDTLLDLANYNDLELEMLVRDGIIKLDMVHYGGKDGS